jgi:hypothetical protein
MLRAHDGGMIEKQDRRSDKRSIEDGLVFVFWESEQGSCQVKTRAVNLSRNGMCFVGKGEMPAGKIVFCALPSQGLYTRARVSHNSGRYWGQLTGVEFLAAPLPAD